MQADTSRPLVKLLSASRLVSRLHDRHRRICLPSARTTWQLLRACPQKQGLLPDGMCPDDARHGWQSCSACRIRRGAPLCLRHRGPTELLHVELWLAGNIRCALRSQAPGISEDCKSKRIAYSHNASLSSPSVDQISLGGPLPSCGSEKPETAPETHRMGSLFHRLTRR